MTAGDVADLIGPTAIAVLALIALTVVGLTVAFVFHEWKWTRRERQVRWGGPADRTLADRLAKHQIEPEHPDEYIATRPVEGKPYYQSDPTVWDNPKENTHDHDHDHDKA